MAGLKGTPKIIQFQPPAVGQPSNQAPDQAVRGPIHCGLKHLQGMHSDVLWTGVISVLHTGVISASPRPPHCFHFAFAQQWMGEHRDSYS